MRVLISLNWGLKLSRKRTSKMFLVMSWKNTGIQKCRRGNIDDIEERYLKLMSNPNKKREVCLAVNFLSKNRLVTAFDNIKNHISFQQKNSVVQLAWILNGFISTCKEADLNCKIYCKI